MIMMDLKKQKRSVNFVLAITYFVILLRLIPIHNAIGNMGAGIFAAGYLLFFIYDFFVRELFSGVLAKMMNSRVKRGQYKDAEQAFDFALPVSILMGMFVMAVVFFFASSLGTALLGIAQAGKVLRYLSPAFVFVTVSAVFSAYLKGMGEHINDSIVRLGTELFVTLLCILMSGMMYDQGEKVAALLKQDIFSGIYGAQGCGLAVSLATFLCMLIYLLLYLQMKVSMKRRLQKDTESQYESNAVYMQGLFVSSANGYLNYILLVLFLFAQERTLVSKINHTSPPAGESASAWGIYACAALPLLLMPFVAACTGARGSWTNYKRAFLRDERKYIRDSIQTKVRRFCMGYVPVCVFIAVFAAPLTTVFAGEAGVGAAGAVRVGAVSAFLYGFAFLMMQVMLGLERHTYMTAIHAAGLISQVIVLQIAVKAGEGVYTGIGTANLVSSAILAGVYGFLISMQLNYRHNALHIAKPVISAGVAGLIGIIIVKLGGKLMGSIVTLIVGLFFFFIFYFVMMIVLQGMTKREISRIPGGEFLLRLLYS